MTLILFVSKFQFLLLPFTAIIGMVAGIFMNKSTLVQRAPRLTFWFTIIVEIVMIKVAYHFGGDLWARFTFSFAMGVLAFTIKLLR